jgi:chaperonin GroEL (HSP60 family)
MNDETELMMAGYEKVYDYTQYSHLNHINVIPEEDFKRLVRDSFKILADNLRRTYGPYGSQLILSQQSQTMTTKDGFNAFEAMGFSHTYKRIVYLAIQNIINRVNRNVGDGTTSCILLAEKIFNNLNEVIKTPDDKRLFLKVIDSIERNFQDQSIIDKDVEAGYVKKLDKVSIENIIAMAANYDYNLTNVILTALDPQYDENGYVVSVRNVVPKEDVSLSAESNAIYETTFLPGDYRAPVHIPNIEDLVELAKRRDMLVVIYDHAFNSVDWTGLRKNWDGTDILIIARAFSNKFVQEDLYSYMKERHMLKQLGKAADEKTHLYLCEMKGDSVQNELKDLAEIIGTKVRGMYDGDVDFNDVPVVNFQVFQHDCLCIFDVKDRDHSEYIERLNIEYKADGSNSYVKFKQLNKRIKSINLGKDALLTVKCGTELEAKLITDKIVDCISIVNSAIESGIIPNILNYAYYRLWPTTQEEIESDLAVKIYAAIRDSVTELFKDIYESKYGEKYDVKKFEETRVFFYSQNDRSYDVVEDKFVDMTERPTSTQYDLEVVVAALSIVKYLLSGGALIFDAHLQKNVNDEGRYIR